MQIARCGHRLLDVMHGVQMGDYIIFTTLAFIMVNVGWNHLSGMILAMVSAFWLLVTKA